MEHMTRVPMFGPYLVKEHRSESVSFYRSRLQTLGHRDIDKYGTHRRETFCQSGLSREDMDRWGARAHLLASRL